MQGPNDLHYAGPFARPHTLRTLKLGAGIPTPLDRQLRDGNGLYLTLGPVLSKVYPATIHWLISWNVEGTVEPRAFNVC